jgi:hypothetical protein
VRLAKLAGINALAPLSMSLLISLCACKAGSESPPVRDLKVHQIYGPECLISNPEAQALHEKAEALYSDGEYVRGIATLECAKRVVEQSKANPSDLANILTTAAEGHMVLDQINEATILLKNSLALVRSEQTTNKTVALRILRDQAFSTLLRGDTSQAPALLEECFALHRATGAREDGPLALTLAVESLLHLLDGQYSKAVQSLDHSSTILLEAFGEQNVFYGQNLNLCAMIQWKTGDYTQAKESC